MRSLTLLLFFALSFSLRAHMLSWPELNQLPLPPTAKHLAYGSDPQQFGELRVPKGAGPFPVIVLIHGGCWQAEFSYGYITRLATWFTDRRVATWTIEYRRLGNDGGGWPGTFLDVAHATDYVRELAKTQPLDLHRVFAAGHSAGGQLALWLASRGKLLLDSALYVKDPLAIRGVLGLAAITDLAQYRIGPPASCHGAVDPLLGGGPDKVPERYAQTSPMERLPLGVPQIFVQGERDPIVDPASVKAYAEAATKAGDHAVILLVPNAGHFETSAPLPATEALLLEAMKLLIQPGPSAASSR
ncbi:MAG: alpha/beta hydrolase [Verrucomicrobiota bacterium]|nr:alpha/beta hydrolase [Verrucomicrobiota bacterium]